jgi:MoaA/NifB/PqqE/SkfB family radical SAM enzyme
MRETRIETNLSLEVPGPRAHVCIQLQDTGSRTRALTAADFKVTGIDLYLTAACNRRCVHCFLSDEYLSSQQRMSLATVREITTWAAASTIEEITLLGGEPALNPDFPAIAVLARRQGFRIRTVTNGSRQFREAMLIPAVAAAMERVAVSLDAPTAEQADQIRGHGAFRDALATIRQLGEQDVAFDINFTPLRSTLGSVRQMIELAESLGAQRINIHWYSVVGRARAHAAEEAISARQWRAVLDEVNDYRPRRQGFQVDCQLGFAFGMPGEDQGMCAVRDRSNLQFMPNGTVFSCGMLVERADLAGYSWREAGLFASAGDTEIARTADPCRGCPIRAAQATAAGAEEPVPLCIYNRLARQLPAGADKRLAALVGGRLQASRGRVRTSDDVVQGFRRRRPAQVPPDHVQGDELNMPLVRHYPHVARPASGRDQVPRPDEVLSTSTRAAPDQHSLAERLARGPQDHRNLSGPRVNPGLGTRRADPMRRDHDPGPGRGGAAQRGPADGDGDQARESGQFCAFTDPAPGGHQKCAERQTSAELVPPAPGHHERARPGDLADREFPRRQRLPGAARARCGHRHCLLLTRLRRRVPWPSAATAPRAGGRTSGPGRFGSARPARPQSASHADGRGRRRPGTAGRPRICEWPAANPGAARGQRAVPGSSCHP